MAFNLHRMPTVYVKLNPVFLHVFTELVEKLASHVSLQLSVPMDGPELDDEDMLAAWQEGLIETVRGDCDQLLHLLRDSGLGERPVKLGEDEAIRVLRACSAVRLKIQQRFLLKFSDEVLETIGLDISTLSPELQRVYGCYVFLAEMQETLVEQLESPEV